MPNVLGNIAALSVATPFSKFGIPLYSHEYILALFEKYRFLNGIMCHVGSQGMSIDSMVCSFHIFSCIEFNCVCRVMSMRFRFKV